MWAAEWNEVVFADESRICLQHHDGRIRVRRHRRERMLNSCIMHHHTGSAQDIMEIGSRVGRNQRAVMRICERWMQEGTTDRRGRSHPPQCTTSREDRQIEHGSDGSLSNITNRSTAH
ncbi:transposable element Tcb1 transposase [Trichonephila clavipes]|uniref:Transposable element Tcb1 transposase n=1 Tax=Trichonephila clavipes TaxID=2585209 RepID=A0A8X6VB57_TRICX|nr:transposable element Tcb1 transposase [Trichonephila clavipes]